ncbi:hypothetical protein [Metabacillus idriensis]|uniref:hypothetical protein n=1 Tax=Metabacillus idriensis TaxID=324768 RepID=UPI00174A99C7|nr:hypothetical protein [Metabacillus idriensis]
MSTKVFYTAGDLIKKFLPLDRLTRRLLFLPERFGYLPAGNVVGLRCFTIRIQKGKHNKSSHNWLLSLKSIILLSLRLLTFSLSARSVWRLSANGTGTYGMLVLSTDRGYRII